MKKVIRGRLYDTETAKRIGDVSGGSEYTNDFAYWCETLYQKKTGEYFLHCEGGALSKYAEKKGSNRGWGEAISPLTYEGAREWGEKNLDGEAYTSEFGTPEEDYTRKFRTFSLQASNIEKLRMISVKCGKPMSVLVDEWIESLDS